MKMWPLDAVFTRWSMVSLTTLLAVLIGAIVISSVAAADDELHQLGLDHLDVIGTRFIDEHHQIHDYPKSDSSEESKPHLLSHDHSDDSHEKSKSHDKHDKSDKSDKKDYHNPIYDHVHVDKTDYSDFGKHSDGSDDKSH